MCLSNAYQAHLSGTDRRKQEQSEPTFLGCGCCLSCVGSPVVIAVVFGVRKTLRVALELCFEVSSVFLHLDAPFHT